MATIIKQVTLNMADFKVRLHDRTKVKDDIQKNWVGKSCSNIGIWGCRFEAGRIKSFQVGGRSDIFLCQLFDVCNAFLWDDRNIVQIDAWSDVSLSKEERQQIENYVKILVHDSKYDEFVARHRKWFDERPWMKIDGMTPEEAVAELKRMGW